MMAKTAAKTVITKQTKQVDASSQHDANVDDSRASDASPLGHHVKCSIERYFTELNGQHPGELYNLVLSEVERPLFKVVMHQTRGNVSKAAQFLGLNRATLRRKLLKYGLLAD